MELNSRFELAEERPDKHEYRSIEIIQSKEQKEKEIKKKLKEPQRPVKTHQMD